MVRFVFALLLAFSSVTANAQTDPATPDAAIDALVDAMNTRDADAYETLIDVDFVFEFAPDAAWLAPPDGRWDSRTEIDVMRRLLSGEPGRVIDGERTPPVADIDVRLDPIDAWERLRSPHGPSHVEAWIRTFSSRILVEFEDGTRTLITRRQRFTVVAARSEATMQVGPFRILDWEELRSDFGALKAHF